MAAINCNRATIALARMGMALEKGKPMTKKTEMERADAGTFLDRLVPRLESVATDHLTPERLIKVYQAGSTKNPKLRECTTESLATSLLLCSQLGLEPLTPLGHMYLIPYGTVCTPIVGYKGMLELIRRTGEIKRINAGVFYRQEMELGYFMAQKEPPNILHQWSGEEYSDEDLAGAYCVVETKDGARYLETVTRGEILKRRARSKAKDSGPWVSDFPAMARKCAVRKLFGGGTVPISAEKMAPVMLAMEHDGDSGDIPKSTKATRTMQAYRTVETTAEVVATDETADATE